MYAFLVRMAALARHLSLFRKIGKAYVQNARRQEVPVDGELPAVSPAPWRLVFRPFAKGSEIESFCLPFDQHMFSKLVKKSLVSAPEAQNSVPGTQPCPEELGL